MFRYEEVQGKIHGVYNNKVLWRSAWLCRATLVSFTALFTVMWISLIIIWRYDLNNDGFALTISSSHYSWTYGPTVILTIIVSLWRQVDYYCKISQPWKDMRSHATDGSKSLLLDYVSPLQVKSLYRATKNRHWAVAASTLAFMILKFITIVSTVLLHSLPTLQSRTVPVITNSKFSESAFWNFVGLNQEKPSYLNLLHSPYVVSTPGPLYAYEGIVENGLPYPNGTIEGYAFQDVDLLEMGENITSLTSPVTAFLSNISCEISSTQLDPAADLREWTYFHAYIKTPTCLASNFSIRGSISFRFYLQDDPPHVLTFTFTPVSCSMNGTASSTSSDNITSASIQSDPPPDLRLAVIIKVYAAPRGASFPDNVQYSGIPPNFTLSRSAATVCAVDYDLREMDLTQDLAKRAITLESSRSDGTSYKFNNLTGSELAESMFALVAGHAENTNVLDLMRATLKAPLPGYESLLDEGNLASSASTVLGGLMAQMVQQFVLVPDATMTNGTAKFSENRLHVLPFSLWTMVAASIIVSFFPLIILLSSVDRVVSQNPTTVAAHAAILTSSPALRSLLRRAATLRTSELTKWLDGHLFKTALDKQGTFYIETVGSAPLFHKAANIKPRTRPQDTILEDQSSGNSSLLEPEDIVSKRGSWIPGNVRYPFITITLVLPILAISGLELLYQESERNEGLTDTSSGVRAYVGYFASFVVVIISSTLNSVDFTFASFAPFSVLARRGKPILRSTLVNLIGEMPPIALYQAFRTRQTGAVFSSLAALIGSTLTIIASGLWVDRPLECNADLRTTSASTWNFSWPETSLDDGGAARTLKILQFQGGEQPPGTWNDLVFPTISDLRIDSEKSRTNLSIVCDDAIAGASCHYQLKIPVLRPQLDCEPISAEEMDQSLIFSYTQETAANGSIINGTSQTMAFQPGGINLPEGCEAYVGDYILGFDDPGWCGLFVNFATGSRNMVQQSFGSGNASLPSDPRGCPSIAVVFGSQPNSRLTKQDFTILSCRQKIQKINTSVMFTKSTEDEGLIGFDNLLQDPTIDETSAEYVTNSVDGTDTFYYRIDHTLYQEFPDVGYTTVMGYNLSLDRVFTAFINGPNITTSEELSAPNQTEKLTKAVTEFYQKYMVLTMNTQVFRKPTNASQNHDIIFEGTVTAQCTRLTIDFASKLTLQIMLTIILVLSGLAFWLGELRGMLPRNPSSIASVMALLADSRLCSQDLIPLGAEWKSDDELARQFESYSVKLGWWEIEGEDQNDQQRCHFGIDIGEPVSIGFKAGKTKGTIQCGRVASPKDLIDE